MEESIRRLHQAGRESEDTVTSEHPPKLPDRYVSLARQASMRGLISVGHCAKRLGISRNRAMADEGEQLEIESSGGGTPGEAKAKARTPDGSGVAEQQ